MIIKENSKSTIAPVPPGISQGVFAQIIDLGTHDETVMGTKETKKARKLYIGWELPFETLTIEGEEKRRRISRKFTASFHKKASLRAMLESARGKPFSEDELKAGFDMKKLLGINCQLNIVHKVVGDKTYANISNVVPLGKGMAPQTLEATPLVFDLPEAGEIEFPEGMPEWIKDVIKQSDEWKSRHGVPDTVGIGGEDAF